MVSSNDIFDAFQQLTVMVVGDVMIDRYLTGAVNRISPEAPVPVVEMKNLENRLGGAANVALNIKALGANPYLFSFIGNDENGKLFQELLPQCGLNSKGILVSDERQSTVKTRVIANNQHLLRVDREDNFPLSDKEEKTFLTAVKDFLDTKEVDVILLQDYNKGVLSENVIREIILEAIKRDIPTAVDPKFKNFWTYKHVTLFKPNLREVQDQLPFDIQAEEDSLMEASKQIKLRLGNQYTLITLSDKGLYYDAADEQAIVKTQARQIADVCGAGDTVFSIAALGLGLPTVKIREIAILANLAGGLVCEEVGVVPINSNKLKREFLQMQR